MIFVNINVLVSSPFKSTELYREKDLKVYKMNLIFQIVWSVAYIRLGATLWLETTKYTAKYYTHIKLPNFIKNKLS